MPLLILTILLLASMTRHKRNVLGCGLIGFVPNRKNTANLEWIKLIMAYNAYRGTDSCGLYMNDEIVKGVTREADIRVFIAKNRIEYEPKCKNKTIIAHARKSSYGTHTEANAHPFTFEHDGRSIILAHNGTIHNMYDLGKKYEVNIIQQDVDSQKLAKIMVEKGYDILNHYRGGAALLWAFDDEPNVMYAFKGASRDKETMDDLEEERPLFFIKNNEGVYISSMREPLDACSNQDLTVYTFAQNVVYRIQNNELQRVYVADRKDTNLPVFYQPASKTSTKTTMEYKKGVDIESPAERKYARSYFLQSPEEFYNEELPMAYSYQGVVAHRVDYVGGRYYCVLHDDMSKIDRRIPLLPSRDVDPSLLLDGIYKVANLSTGEAYAHIPKTNSSETPSYHFYKGVLIRKDKARKFEEKLRKRLNSMSNPFEKIRQLSAYSVYPITFTYSEAKLMKSSELKFYHGGKVLLNGTQFSPVFSKRRYAIDNKGFLCQISVEKISEEIIHNTKIIHLKPEEKSAAGLPQLQSVDFDKVRAFESVLELPYSRYRGLNNQEEQEKLNGEEVDGVLDEFYVCNIDEELVFYGGDVKRLAVYLSLKEILPRANDEVGEEYLKKRVEDIIEESSSLNTGLIELVESTLKGIDFKKMINLAVVKVEADERKLYESLKDKEEDDDKKTITIPGQASN